MTYIYCNKPEEGCYNGEMLPNLNIRMECSCLMYGCESWTVKKAEHRRIDAFDLWCWRRLLRVP